MKNMRDVMVATCYVDEIEIEPHRRMQKIMRATQLLFFVKNYYSNYV